MHTLLAAIWLVPARLRAGWRMLLVAAAGVLGAATLLAAAPIYAGAMSDLGVQFRLQRELGDRTLQSATIEGLLVTPQALAQRTALDRTLEARLGWLANRTFAIDRSERLTLQLGPGVLTDPWLSGGQVRGYTFVPLLYRMEKRGWIKGAWENTNSGRKRRCYRLTPAGLKQLAPLRAEWRLFFRALHRLAGVGNA